MLKALHTTLAVIAALGMSSVFASDPFSPGGTRSGWSAYTMPNGDVRFYAGGQPVGGFTASQLGNTTRFTFAPVASSPAPRVSGDSSFTTVKRIGDGFTLEQRANLPVPGRDLTHPVALRKPITHTTMARAFAKTLPIVGNAFAMKELLEELFGDVTWDPATGSFKTSPVPTSSSSFAPASTVWMYSYQAHESYRRTTKQAACQIAVDAFNAVNTNWVASNATVNGDNSCTYRYAPTSNTANWQVLTYGTYRSYAPNDCGTNATFGGTSCTCNTGFVREADACVVAPVVVPEAITQAKLEEKLDSLPSIPPEADGLLDSIPEPALRDIANESAGPNVSVIPYTPDGQPSLLPWVSPGNITESQIDQLGQQPQRITTTTTETVRATPVQDGVRYDTITSSETVTQPLDPATGQPAVDPVTGQPVTPTTTTTTTTTAPAEPAPSENQITCGLPGTPPCKIDESGTPEAESANLDQADQEIENFKSGLGAKVQEKLDEIEHEWTWSFALPTGCSALQFDTRVGPIVEIDMCQHQPMIHDIMSMLWAAAGVFGALMIFLRANG